MTKLEVKIKEQETRLEDRELYFASATHEMRSQFSFG
jgi:hypothetical protein